jgi:hypothetical protein
MSETVTTTEQAGGNAAAYEPQHVLSSEPDDAGQAPQQTDGQAQGEQHQGEHQQADGEAEGGGEQGQQRETEAQRLERERQAHNRRVAQITRQKYQERERANRLEQELAHYRAQLQQAAGGNGQTTPDGLPPNWQQIPAIRQYVEEQAKVVGKVEAFINAGAAEFPDWDERRARLMDMGADQGIAQILVEMPAGHRVAAALYDDPDELSRISDMTSQTARAAALGRLAARIEARRAPPPNPVRRASTLPPPIQPPAASRARGEPDPEKGSMEEFEKWSRSVNWRNR